MKKLGMFTGTIYDDSFNDSDIKECCIQLSDYQASDPDYIEEKRFKNKRYCAECLGCSMADEQYIKGLLESVGFRKRVHI